MRKLLMMIGLIIALLLLFGAAACGGGGQGAGLSPADETPEGILTAAMAAAEEMTSASGDFEMAVTMEVEADQLPPAAEAFVGDPMTVSGTFAVGDDPQAVDLSLALSMLGTSMDFGMRMLDTAAWLELGGSWYEAPPEMTQMMGDPSRHDAQMEDMEQTLAKLAIDPLTWIKDLSLVGEETIEGTVAYHLTGSPDLAQMMTDALGILQDPASMKLLDPSGSATEMMGVGSLVPSPEELDQMQQQLVSMFQEFSADVWIAKDSLLPMRFEATAKIVPPAGEDAMGLNAVLLDVALSLRDINESVTVEAPASAQPWTDLEKALEENPGMLFGPLGGLLGMAGAGPGTF